MWELLFLLFINIAASFSPAEHDINRRRVGGDGAPCNDNQTHSEAGREHNPMRC